MAEGLTVSKLALYNIGQNSTKLAETRSLRPNALVPDPDTIHDMPSYESAV